VSISAIVTPAPLWACVSIAAVIPICPNHGAE
jgi:hypothetical protein